MKGIMCNNLFNFWRFAVLAACLIFTGINPVFAQDQELSTLKKKLTAATPDTSKVNVLNRIGMYFISRPVPEANLPDSAIKFSHRAFELSSKIGFYKGAGASLMLLAKGYLNKGDSLKTNVFTKKAVQLLQKHGLYREAGEAALKLEEFYVFFGGQDLNVRAAYYERALPLFIKAGVRDRQAATLKILGDFYQLLGHYEKAAEDLQKALTLYQSVGEKDLQAVYDLLNAVYARIGNLNEALKYGILAVRLGEANKDKSMQMCTTYNRLGITYYYLKRLEDAKGLFYKSIAIARDHKDRNSVVMLSCNLSNILMQTRKSDEAFVLLQSVQKEFPPEILPLKIQLAISLINVSTILKKYTLAAEHIKQVLLLSKDLPKFNKDKQMADYSAALYYTAVKDFKAARKHLNDFKEGSKINNEISELRSSYVIEYRIDSAEGKFLSAIKSYGRYSSLNDIIFNERMTKDIAQLEIQYQNEQKDKNLRIKEQNIQLLRKQGALQKANLLQEQKSQNLMKGGALLLVLLIGLGYNRYRMGQRINKELHWQQNQIDHKNESLSCLIQEKDRLLEEKEWLMKEIHHRVKNNLQIVISLLNSQSVYLKNEAAVKAIRESQHRMQSISLIHQKLYQSDNLALVDIQTYVTDLVVYLKESFNAGDRIDFKLNVISSEFDVNKAVPLGLILNEAITNSIKYAFGTEAQAIISVSLSRENDRFVLIISDNGKGLQEQQFLEGKTLGMSLMKGLSQQIEGTFEVQAKNGLTITIKFP